MARQLVQEEAEALVRDYLERLRPLSFQDADIRSAGLTIDAIRSAVIVLVNSYPLPARPSVAAPDRSAVWTWLAPLLDNGTVECFYPKPGRGAVAVFHVDSAETLQGHLTEWSERVPCTFEVTLLVDADYQKQMVGHTTE